MQYLTMLIDREDLISLIKGQIPDNESMNYPLIKRCGQRIHNDWIWNTFVLENSSMKELLTIYETIKAVKRRKQYMKEEDIYEDELVSYTEEDT